MPSMKSEMKLVDASCARGMPKHTAMMMRHQIRKFQNCTLWMLMGGTVT